MKETPQTHLNALQSVFRRLRYASLPAEAHTKLQEAEQHLTRLTEQLAQNAEQTRLAALYGVSHALGSSLDLNQVLTQVMDSVIALTKAERGFLVLVEPETHALSLKAARNIEHENLDDSEMEVSRTVIRTVIDSGQAVVTTDAQTDARFSGQTSVVVYALRSIMCAPLRVRNETIGVVYVDNRAQSGVFTDADLSLLSTFAGQAAIAIENARLYTRTDQALAARVAELETLAQIDRDLNAHLELESILVSTGEWAARLTGATGSWIALAGEENPDLVVATGSEQGRIIKLDDPLANCLKSNQVETFPAQEGKPERLLAPLQQAGKPVGVLAVEAAAPFSAAAYQALERMAPRAASAIQNARLYHSVQQANLAKSKFVSVVTHEIRIPMTSIKGYTDLMRGGMVGPVNETQLSFLNIIRNNVERMSALVSDLSDISHMETGRLKLQLAAVSVSDYIEESINNLHSSLEEKKQTLTSEVASDLPNITADPNRLVQVLNNLLGNASKYSPEGAHITVRARLEGTHVRVEVSDTGYGMSPEDQSKLFTQFFRSEDPNVREQQGWGLGLNVNKRLVELMGGEIGAQSVLKEGSTFWFTIPVAPPEQA
jgi:signal transduction histidine kinase